MKNFKKVFWITMIFTMIFSTTALADSPGSFGLTQDNIITEQTKGSSFSNNYLSPEEYELLLAEIRQKAEGEITSELKEKVKDIRSELNNSEEFRDSSKVSPMASYDSVSLEALLNRNDGLSLTDIFKIGVTHANTARDEAIKLYTDTATEMKRDAFRHMTWNFHSLKDVGEHKTRVATINHEWAYKILPEVNRYEQARFDYLYKTYWPYLTVSEIQAMAKVEADAYAITYRDGLIASSKSSLAVFNSTFKENSYIMDFWNNKVGRDYGKSNPSSSANTVFTTAWNANKLIKNESNTAVTSSIRSTLHSSNWWYIN